MTIPTLLGRFFGVVKRSRTWTGLLYHVLAFPLGLFYFVFLSMGLILGVSLVIVWVGLLILLVMLGSWWFFGAAERLQARYLLGADVPPSPRAWESASGVWAKLKAHLGSGATWRELVYLFAKLFFGIISFSLLIFLVSIVGVALVGVPLGAVFDLRIISWSSGGWTPSLLAAVVSPPIGVLLLIAGLHLLNGWSWICARWAELLLGGPPPAPSADAGGPPLELAPIVQYAPAGRSDTVNSPVEEKR